MISWFCRNYQKMFAPEDRREASGGAGIYAIGNLACPWVDRIVAAYADGLPRHGARRMRAWPGYCGHRDAIIERRVGRARQAAVRGHELDETRLQDAHLHPDLQASLGALRDARQRHHGQHAERDHEHDDRDERAAQPFLASAHQCVRGPRPAFVITARTEGRETRSSKWAVVAFSLRESST